MKRTPLDYELKARSRPLANNGVIALILSIIAPLIVGNGFVWSSLSRSDVWCGFAILISWISWLLSFGFASYAWGDGRQSRKFGLLAIGVSLSWAAVFCLMLVS